MCYSDVFRGLLFSCCPVGHTDSRDAFFVNANLTNGNVHAFSSLCFVKRFCWQDITRISHRDEVNDLIRKGRLLEKSVLVTAVKAHIEDRIIVYNNKCVLFDG